MYFFAASSASDARGDSITTGVNPAGDAGDTSPQYFGWGDVSGNIPPIFYVLSDIKVKVKFSHTRYRALGPELIPVYRQSARR